MKKGSSITKLVIVCVVLIIGVIASMCSFEHVFGTSYNYNSFASSISLGLDLKGGVSAVYEASSDDSTSDFETKLSATQTRLTDLLVGKGYTEAVVVTEGGNRIRVDVPDENNPSAIFEIIGKPAKVEFVIEGTEDVILNSDDVISATSAFGNTGNDYTGYYVQLELTTDGQSKFSTATAENIGKNMEIYLVYSDKDTEETSKELVSSASIGSQITGNPIITLGSSSDSAYADELADKIMSGTFDLTLTLISADSVPPTLGELALNYSLIAGAIGLVLIIIILIIRYRFMGVASALSLTAYTVLMLFFLAVFPLVQLSLPGIAGVLLSIGMAVDGNIVISERIRDEFKSGKSILASFHAGIKKSRSSIIDGNITTLIAAFILAFLGTGSVSGFGITLAIGIILAMISTLLIYWFVLRQFVNLCCADENNAKKLGLKRPAEIAAPKEETPVLVETNEEGGTL